MKKSKAMKGLEHDVKYVDAEAREFDDRLRDDIDDIDDIDNFDRFDRFDRNVKPDMGRAKGKTDNAGRNLSSHVEEAGTKTKNHFNNRKK